MHIKTIINILNYTRGKSEVQFKMQYVFTRVFTLRKKFGNYNGVNAKKKKDRCFSKIFFFLKGWLLKRTLLSVCFELCISQ